MEGVEPASGMEEEKMNSKAQTDKLGQESKAALSSG